jgi:hypothetical protein
MYRKPIVIIPETENVPDTWSMLLKDWINWFSNKLEGFGDYIPDSWSYDSEAMDPVDKQILADQAKQKTLRNELSRLKVQREKIIRSNHRDDLGRAKQKLKFAKIGIQRNPRIWSSRKSV